jgi:glucosamine--fructose-6-phosphate aminotransferase (isomerizing)
VNHLYDGDLFDAVQRAALRLKGSFALAVFCRDEPHRVVGAREGSPLIVGVGKGENFLASDAMALAGVTDQIVYLEEGDVVDLQMGKHWIVSRLSDGRYQRAQREVRTVHAHSGAAELGPYRHYMQKRSLSAARIADTLDGVGGLDPSLFGDHAKKVFDGVDRVDPCLRHQLLQHRPLLARGRLADDGGDCERIPLPGERARPTHAGGHHQPERRDGRQIAALKHARNLGMERTLTICNVATSAMVRECKLAFITRAGVEIGVASTKAFTTQLVALFLLTLVLAKFRGKLPEKGEVAALRNLRHLPSAVQSVLALEPQIISWAEAFVQRQHALFLGRGQHYPIALEGALKLKEISYIHAEAYPAGELKHGPLALVDAEMPVVTVAPADDLLEKLKSNMQEVRARGGQLYVFADADTRIESSTGIHVIRLPEHYGALSPILHVVPLQLLAYHTALLRGTDVDKPRNLAKSVTVE